MSEAVVVCEGIGHSYGTREALRDVDLRVERGELFGLLGPNGGGKSTLFRILATLLAPSRGRALVHGHDVSAHPREVRRAIGVAFQHPSLDGKLGVRENLVHQGHLHGLRGRVLSERIDEVLDLFRLRERARDRAETLSGGLARRVDLAKAFLHAPAVLLLDEPSTGLDPSARRDLLAAIARLRDEKGTTALLTTHLTEEADVCDSVAILDHGRLVAHGRPEALVREIGGEVITLTAAEDAGELARDVHERLGCEAAADGDLVRLERENAAELLPGVLAAFGGRVRSATVARPTLEDVFFRRTGRTWHAEGDDE